MSIANPMKNHNKPEIDTFRDNYRTYRIGRESNPMDRWNNFIVSGSFCECRNGQQVWYSVKFARSDAGRAESKRPKQRNDCTVRAVAVALDLPYDAAYDMLAQSGRKSGNRFHFRSWADERFQWLPFPAVKGQCRMNPAKFCSEYPTGRYIIRTAKHVIAVVDGVVIDEFSPRPDRCIYGAWRVF